MLLTTGCSGQEELPVTSAVFPERSSVAQKQSEIIMSSSFYSPFPDDKIRFDFPFHLKADRFYETGTPPVARRGLVLEFLEGSAESNWGSVVDSLAAAGYRPIGSPKTESNGRKIQGFTKDGQPRLTVAISDDPTENPANPDIERASGGERGCQNG